jgi:LysM repeat protein
LLATRIESLFLGLVLIVMRTSNFSPSARILFALLLCAGLCLTGAAAEQRVYVVKRGETLSGIARANGLSTSALAERNGLSRNHHVKAGQRLVLPGIRVTVSTSTASKNAIYTVKRGDTLTDVARAHSLSVGELAAMNDLSRDHELSVGDRLKVPEDKTPDEPARSLSSSGALPGSISSAISNASVTPGRWKYIVIHHSGVNEGTVKGMDNYHRQVRHMENGLAYHFVIGNGNGMSNGEIAAGNRWKKQLDGGHLASVSQNKVALGICLVGNFDRTPPSAAQMQSLNALVRTLMKRCNISASNVKTHQQINVIGTRCPGTRFPTKAFLAGLKS